MSNKWQGYPLEVRSAYYRLRSRRPENRTLYDLSWQRVKNGRYFSPIGGHVKRLGRRKWALWSPTSSWFSRFALSTYAACKRCGSYRALPEQLKILDVTIENAVKVAELIEQGRAS